MLLGKGEMLPPTRGMNKMDITMWAPHKGNGWLANHMPSGLGMEVSYERIS